jgi:Mg-chelatase subunit ChlD
VPPDGDDPDGAAAGPPPPTTSKTMTTAEIGEARPLAEVLEDAPPDPAVRKAVQQITSRLAVRRATAARDAERGPGRPRSLPYQGDADEIDIDATLEVLAERPVPEDSDIIVRSRVRARRAVALIVDVSGSMKGEKALVAAATVGALAGELVDEELTVVAFWKDCAMLTVPGQRVRATQVLDDLLHLPTKGLTNVNVGLAVAARELARSRCRERVAVLLSDCVHNAGPDPRDAAVRLPRLHVMLQVDGEHDAWLGGELARVGGGRLAPVRHAREVAPAINRLLRR